jgi:hypothetical protein
MTAWQSAINEGERMDINVGDKFKKVYPFKHWEQDYKCVFGGHKTDSGWAGGCHTHEEDNGSGWTTSTYYTADAEGFIEYEVLAVVDMPRKYQTRIIYRVTMIEPEGSERKSSKCHTVTESKFKQWIEAGHSSYPHEYVVD